MFLYHILPLYEYLVFYYNLTRLKEFPPNSIHMSPFYTCGNQTIRL